MPRLCTSLVFLLLLLTFNAYACVLPLQTASNMDCSSTTEDSPRQTCDAFLEIGPHSKHISDHSSSITPLEVAIFSFPSILSLRTGFPTRPQPFNTLRFTSQSPVQF